MSQDSPTSGDVALALLLLDRLAISAERIAAALELNNKLSAAQIATVCGDRPKHALAIALREEAVVEALGLEVPR